MYPILGILLLVASHLIISVVIISKFVCLFFLLPLCSVILFSLSFYFYYVVYIHCIILKTNIIVSCRWNRSLDIDSLKRKKQKIKKEYVIKNITNSLSNVSYLFNDKKDCIIYKVMQYFFKNHNFYMKQRRNRELFICTWYNIYKDDLIFLKKKHYHVKDLKSWIFIFVQYRLNFYSNIEIDKNHIWNISYSSSVSTFNFQ